MKKMKAGILTLCVCAVPHLAHAQSMQFSDKGWVSFTAGGQFGSHDITTSSTFDLYGEQATTGSSQTITGGAMVDFGGAYRVWRNNLLAGVSFSHESSQSNVDITASIPDPVVFGKMRNVTSQVTGADHDENALHFSAIWMFPIANKLDVGVFGGPTIFFVKQDIVETLTVTEPVPTVTGPLVKISKTTGGINLGVDAQYLIWDKIALGGMMRYTWGSATISGSKLTVGGFELGGGARYRF